MESLSVMVDSSFSTTKGRVLSKNPSISNRIAKRRRRGCSYTAHHGPWQISWLDHGLGRNRIPCSCLAPQA